MLDSGMVLIAGGEGSSGFLTTAELYDPATGTFTIAGGSLNTARVGHTATMLNNGMVLITGGSNPSTIFPGPSFTIPLPKPSPTPVA